MPKSGRGSVRNTLQETIHIPGDPYPANINAFGSPLGIDPVTAVNCSICWIDDNVVAYHDDYNDMINAYKIIPDGSQWQFVPYGNDFPIGISMSVSTMQTLAKNRVAIIDLATDKLYAFEFNGTNWSAIGTPLSVPTLYIASITRLSDNLIAVLTSGYLITYQFNGSSWSQVGNSFAHGINVGSSRTPCCAISSTRIVGLMQQTYAIFDFDGTDWSILWQNDPGFGLTYCTVDYDDVSGNIIVYNSGASRSFDIAVFKIENNAMVQKATIDHITTTSGTPYSCKLNNNRFAYFTKGEKLLYGVEYYFNNAKLKASTDDIPSVIVWLTDSILLHYRTSTGYLKAYYYDGESLTQIGNTYTLASSSAVLARLTDTQFVIYTNITTDNIITFNFDGTDFSVVGNPFTHVRVSTMAKSGMCALTSTRIVTASHTDYTLYVLDFDGTNWSVFASKYVGGGGEYGLHRLTDNRFVYFGNVHNQLRVYDLVGTTISQVGNSLTVTANAANFGHISDSEFYAYMDSLSNGLELIKCSFDGTNIKFDHYYGFRGQLDMSSSPYSPNTIILWGLLLTLNIYEIDATLAPSQDITNTYTNVFVLVQTSSTSFEIRKGVGQNPSSFSVVATYSSGVSIICPSICIDSSGVIHISWLDDQGKASPLMYATFNTETDTLSSPESVVADIGEDPSVENLYTAITVDQNNVPHILYTSCVKISGALTYPAIYINKIGGTWNSPVQVYYAAGDHCYYLDITIDLNNIPFLALTNKDSAYASAFRNRWFIGNANNATSFTAETVGFANTLKLTSISIDSSGNHYVAYSRISTVIEIIIHLSGNPWSTYTRVEKTVTSGIGSLSIVAIESDIYCFYENSDNDVVFDIYHVSTDTWEGETVLEAGTFNSVIARGGTFEEFEIINSIDYIFLDETASPDVWWNSISLSSDPWLVKSLKAYLSGSWTNKPLKSYIGGSWLEKSLKLHQS